MDKKVLDVSVERKVFGIGVESYTTGSNEFYLNYAVPRGILNLIDKGIIIQQKMSQIRYLQCLLSPKISIPYISSSKIG